MQRGLEAPGEVGVGKVAGAGRGAQAQAGEQERAAREDAAEECARDPHG